MSKLVYSCCVLLLLCILCVYAGKDFYKILGVPRGASDDQIKRAYRQLTKKYHPDINKEKDAGEKYVQIQKAYEVLSNAKTRQVYDNYGEEGLNQQQQQGGGHHDFGANIFQQFFGGDGGGFQFHFGGGDMFGGGSENQEDDFKGEDLTIPLRVSLEELYTGKTIQYKRIRSAHHDGATPRECQCRNKVVKMMIINGVMKRVTENKCEECRNRFEVIQKTSDLTIDIEPGMNDGESITMYGEGDATQETMAADLIFQILAAPHPVFTRKGTDLHMKMKISLKEALVGFKRTIKHLDARQVEITSTEVLKPGVIKRIRSEGMPVRNNPTQKGDLYIEFDVEFPTTLSTEQKDHLNKIL